MKSVFYFNIILAVFLLSLNCERIDEIKDAQQKIQVTLDRFYSYQEQKNLESLSSLYQPHAKVLAIGPKINDRANGTDNIQTYWQRFLENLAEIKIWRSDEISEINYAGNVAWISSVNRIDAKIDSQSVTRKYFFTAVLQKSGRNWFFVQTHISVPQDSAHQFIQPNVITHPDTSAKSDSLQRSEAKY